MPSVRRSLLMPNEIEMKEGKVNGHPPVSNEQKVEIAKRDLEWLRNELAKWTAGVSESQKQKRVGIAIRTGRIDDVLDLCADKINEAQALRNAVDAMQVNVTTAMDGLYMFLVAISHLEMSDDARSQIQMQIDAIDQAKAAATTVTTEADDHEPSETDKAG